MANDSISIGYQYIPVQHWLTHASSYPSTLWTYSHSRNLVASLEVYSWASQESKSKL